MDNLLRLDSVVLSRSEEDPATGFLKCPAQVTRPGILTYMQAGKVRRELRRPEEVFRADSMATLQNKPFVNGHPYALGGEVNAGNAKRIMRGMSGAPAYKDPSNNHLCVDVFICDEDTIKKAKAGKIALSAGYTVDTIEKPGEWEGQRYDAEQVNIRYNHIALVDVGRAGKEAKLRLDEALNEISDSQETAIMVQIKLDSGKVIEVSEEVAAAFKQVQGFQQEAMTRADEAEAELLVVRNENTSLQGAHDGLKTRLDSIEGDKGKKAADAAFKLQVKERSTLIATAQGILPAKEHGRLDEMDNIEIMQAVIRCDAGDQELKLDSAEAYLKGRFEQVLISRAGKGGNKKATDLGAKINEARSDEAGVRADGDEEDAEDPADAKKKKLTERYKRSPQAGK